MEPLVSIVAPAFNSEKYIKSFIDSVIAQKYKNWELIIVDDGSTDKTVEIVRSYMLSDKRIQLKERDRQPKGSLTCRNIGIDKATGKYLVQLDSDDIITPFCIEQRVKFMEEHPDVDYSLFKGASVIEKDGKLEQNGQFWGIQPNEDVLSLFLKAEYPYSVWNSIYRMNKFKDYRWDEKVKIYTDFSYIVPCLINNYKYAFDENSNVDYLYRVGQTSNAMTTKFVTDERYLSTKYLFTKTMNQILSCDNSKKYKKDFRSFFLLQYRRVLINGTDEQIEDFIHFYRTYYGKDLRMKLVYFISKAIGIKDDTKLRRIMTLCYNPTKLIKK